MRRYLAVILIVLGLAVLGVRAEDFWVKQEWKNWSKDDCKRMLQSSPWTVKWAQAEPAPSPQNAEVSPGTTSMPRMPHYVDVHYYIQDRSSTPVREACVRQLQFDNNYEKMDDAHKKVFDAQAESFLGRTFDDVILIHVDYGSGGAFQEQLQGYWKNVSEDNIRLKVALINQRGDRIPPARFDSQKNADRSFELYFPRMKNGEPIIQENDKSFSIEFRNPAVGSQDSGGQPGTAIANMSNPTGERVLAEFKLETMIWKGKPSF